MNRGSEWRRWELHLHTPFTKKNDCYHGHTPAEKWGHFYQAIRDYIGDGSDPLRAICAIAITDYTSIDNYLKVRQDIRRAMANHTVLFPECVKLVFPNVELRMTPPTSQSPINIHCLFSPDVADSLNERFFAQLRHGNYSATKNELIRLGRDFSYSPLSDEEAYKIGLNQFVIDLADLKAVFDNAPDLRQKTIIVVSNKSTDGVSGLRAHSDYFVGNVSSLETTRRDIYKFSDMIFSSNPKDIAYFLGKTNRDDVETVKRKCGSLKPCVHGCDAHNYSQIFEPPQNKYCWIKADPTFEGLRQVLYEPEERVRISSVIPDSKPDYYVIDHIQINDPDFSPSPIYFSDKLTCIIGGKSTGKSTLLRNIAATIDMEQVQEKEGLAPTNVKALSGMTVVWRDGQVMTSDTEFHRKIVYIPQTYLNRLSDKEEETTEIDQIIEHIVLQDSKCYEAHQLLRQKLAQQEQELVKDLIDFARVVSDQRAILEQQREIGDPDAICKEIEKLTIQSATLTQNFNVTEEEVQEYQSACEQMRTLQARDVTLQQEEAYISAIPSVVGLFSYSQRITESKTEFDRETQLVKQAADDLWLKRKPVLLSTISAKHQNVLMELKRVTTIIANLRPKMEGNAQLQAVSNALLRERQKMNDWSRLADQYQRLYDEYLVLLNKLSCAFSSFNQPYEEYTRTINTNLAFSQNLGDLEFVVKRVFHARLFCKKLEELLDRRLMSRLGAFDSQKISESSLTEQDITKATLSAFIESVVRGDIRFKSEYTLETGLRELLVDWNHIDYVVKMDGDEVQNMSPGKKALVLLRLLISLAESNCPILIDQPEDDLDNRSVYEELVHFIRDKKKKRQIITVTHNANIVLGCDAELVIVANQENQNTKILNTQRHRFEYRGGSIEDNSPVYANGQIETGILNEKGMQEHICEVLEGGKQAFTLRKEKYYFIKP